MLICQIVANMGVTNVVVTIFMMFLMVCFLTERQLLFLVADLIANMWLMLLPLVDCSFVG